MLQVVRKAVLNDQLVTGCFSCNNSRESVFETSQAFQTGCAFSFFALKARFLRENPTLCTNQRLHRVPFAAFTRAWGIFIYD